MLLPEAEHGRPSRAVTSVPAGENRSLSGLSFSHAEDRLHRSVGWNELSRLISPDQPSPCPDNDWTPLLRLPATRLALVDT